MATHSSTLAWRIPQTEEPGGLQSTGSQSQTRLSNKIITTTFSLPLKPQLVLQPSIIFSIKKRSPSKDAEASSALPLYNALFLYWTVCNLKAEITAI